MFQYKWWFLAGVVGVCPMAQAGVIAQQVDGPGVASIVTLQEGDPDALDNTVSFVFTFSYTDPALRPAAMTFAVDNSPAGVGPTTQYQFGYFFNNETPVTWPGLDVTLTTPVPELAFEDQLAGGGIVWNDDAPTQVSDHRLSWTETSVPANHPNLLIFFVDVPNAATGDGYDFTLSLTPLPEPATGLLLLPALVLTAKRRRGQAA